MTPTLYAQAKKYHAQDINVIPLGKSKRPLSPYKDWYESRMSDDQFEALWERHNGPTVGIGLLGTEENRLVSVDVDDAEILADFHDRMEQGIPEVLKKMLVVETGSGKRHYDFFTAEPTGGRKVLAHNVGGHIRIEWRAARSMTVAAGTTSKCHKSGKPYRRIAGPQIDDIQTLSMEEVAQLRAVIGEFNEFIPDDHVVEKEGTDLDMSRPGDDFANNGTWKEIFAADDLPESKRWQLVREDDDGSQYWLHPESKSGAEWSLKTGFMSKHGREVCFVYSLGSGLDGERTYNRFQALAVLHYGGDFKRAALELFEAGYGDQNNAVESAHKISRGPWPSLDDDALHGIAGEFVHLMLPHTEADSAALLFQFLTVFGNMAGRNSFFRVEGDRHYPKLFNCLVGDSAKSRKGTSLSRVMQLIEMVDADYLQQNRVSGIGSGQALIWAVRDEIATLTTTDPGVLDKRLLVEESEMAVILGTIRREGDILSAVARDAWDNRPLLNTVKGSPARAMTSHISIAGHITQSELLKKLTAVELANGFANRFIWVCVRRSKLLPHGGDPDLAAMKKLAGKIKKILRTIDRRGDFQIPRTEAADAMWSDIYMELADTATGGIVESLTARAEAQIVRLSLLYALLDGSDVIETEHLTAAKAAWDYCDRSIQYLYLHFDEPDAEFLTLKQTANWIRTSRFKGRITARELQQSRHLKSAAEAKQMFADMKDAELGRVETSKAANGKTVTRFVVF